MNSGKADVVVVGAGPVGLMCAHLGQLCGLKTVIVDPTDGPLKVGRADALNARTLQLLEIGNLFDELYALGKTCNTSSVWANGGFVSRQSSWWEELEGCFHKHFLMLGQSFVEKLLDERLARGGAGVMRSVSAERVEILDGGCLTTLSNGEVISSKFVVGADGSRSFVRNYFRIPFEVVRPQMIWAVVDGVIETDFPKVPEIIAFQTDSSDVAWIPRESNVDRFYVRMDTNCFTQEEVLQKINRAIRPHSLRFQEIIWFSQFSVKESVADSFSVGERVFLAGDACHIHSVNGGQGLNTGFADAFNLVWKLNMVLNHGAPSELLQSYEKERRPVAQSVIETSGELVRSTKFSATGFHARDYVSIVQKRAGNITGMGVRYGEEGLAGTRVFDFEIHRGAQRTRLYSLLDYSQFTLLVFGEGEVDIAFPPFVKLVQVAPHRRLSGFWSESSPYRDRVLLVRPDSYIQSHSSLDHIGSLLEGMKW